MHPLIVVQQFSLKYACPLRVALGILIATIFSCLAQDSRGLPARAALPGASVHQIHAAYLFNRQPAGSYDEKSETTAGGEIQTVINSDLIFNRLGSRLEMKSSSQFDETREGQLEVATGDVSSSQQTTHIEAAVSAGSLQIKTTSGGKTYERTVPLGGTLLGPEGARRLILDRCHSTGDAVSYDAFFPEVGTVVRITDTVIGWEDVVTDPGKMFGLKLKQTISAMPGNMILWLDRDGWLLRQTLPSPLGDIEAIRSDAHGSNSQVQGAALPEESFTRSIIKANVRLPEERLVDSIRLQIIHKQPELGWPNLETDNQRVIERTANYVILDVNRPQPRGPQARLVARDRALAPYLSPNALLQSDDANILAIAKKVAGKERDPWKAARALQTWTNEHMQFDPGIMVAPASEVARNLRGTCFGYSMLLGALTRAAGIPSRLRMGYVYAGGTWGGHAWIDVRIGNGWVPIDGALYSPGAADAARFSFFSSGLEEGALVGMGSLSQLFGHADIKILQYTVGGKRVEVPENAAPFVIDRDTYRNPWLGLSLVKPSSFHFVDSDLAWPQTTLIGIEGPDGQKVTVSDLSESEPAEKFDPKKLLRSEGITGESFTIRIAGKKVLTVSSAQKAGAIFTDHGNVWMITATGFDAKNLLIRASSSLAFAR